MEKRIGAVRESRLAKRVVDQFRWESLVAGRPSNWTGASGGTTKTIAEVVSAVCRIKFGSHVQIHVQIHV